MNHQNEREECQDKGKNFKVIRKKIVLKDGVRKKEFEMSHFL